MVVDVGYEDVPDGIYMFLYYSCHILLIMSENIVLYYV